GGVGRDVGGDEAVLVDAALELLDAVARVLRPRPLRQPAGAGELRRLGLDELEGEVVLVAVPGEEVVLVLHPAVELERVGADYLDVDVAGVEIAGEDAGDV